MYGLLQSIRFARINSHSLAGEIRAADTTFWELSSSRTSHPKSYERKCIFSLTFYRDKPTQRLELEATAQLKLQELSDHYLITACTEKSRPCVSQ